MQLAVVSPQALQEQIHATWGKDPSRLSTLVEAIRCELSARTTSSRKALCERVQSLLAPVVQFDQETIRDALDMLESSGDITSGPGGIVASAPLRAVQLMEGVYLLFSSAPTTQLSSQLPVLSITEGVERRAEISAENTTAFQEAVQDLGGLVISPERWAGLDRGLPAGPQWIEGLDLRLKQAFKPAGGWEGELVIPWRVYLPDPKRKSQRESWKKEVAEGHLWQAKNNRNRWLYAWTGGESPEIQSFVR